MSGEERSARRAGEERSTCYVGEERIADGTHKRGKTDIDRDRAIGFAYWALVASVEKIIANVIYSKCNMSSEERSNNLCAYLYAIGLLSILKWIDKCD